VCDDKILILVVLVDKINLVVGFKFLRVFKMPQLFWFRRVNAAKFILLFGFILTSLLVISLQKCKWNLGNLANSFKNRRFRVLGENVESVVVSDLKRYKCQSMTRYGSNSNADGLYRIDGTML
jgi:hypothetical protein